MSDEINKQSMGSFWSTVPGIMTAIGGTIGAIAALITALIAAGVIGPSQHSESKTSSAANQSATSPSTASAAANGAEAPVLTGRQQFLGALDGIYYNNKADQLTVDWAKRSFSLLRANCEISGNLVESDGFWRVAVVSTDGLCDLIDDDDIGKEVGKITPEKGALTNSGRVTRALLNFDKSSLAELSGVYEFKYSDLEALRRAKGFDQ